ncbi:Sec24-related protein [Plasmodium cynomolgi strain B]|uniref:Sec24-related protein n=1 Tax=Plasmodium cynomolgi (strain B) TaxID=1120755 RepID=K6UCE6_PLACD|nr:Sec24-related protein [Plasmodium cynomolgi strain B]GAB64716.1 Sec24-related protein [Plasmodium cynomolgi strain B]
MKSTLYQIPLFSETLKLSQIPFGIIVNPFACLNEGENVDKIDMKDIINDKEENIEILRCPKCLSYLHATILEDISSTVQCVFCDTDFLINENVLFDIYQYNEKIGHRESNHHGYSLSPLLKGSVDIIIPPIYYHNVNNFKLTYTYLSKNINQTASMITNKIMSLTKHISSSLVANDSKGGNKPTSGSAFGDSGEATFFSGGGYTNYGGMGGYSAYDSQSAYNNHSVVNNRVGSSAGNHPYGNDHAVQNFDNLTDNANLTMNDMKNLLCEKSGESDTAKMRRNSLLAKYPQVKNMLPPYFVFVVECSYNAIYNNITYTILEGIRYAVQNVKCPRTKIAIITFNSSIYFYHCKRGEQEAGGSGGRGSSGRGSSGRGSSGNHQVIVMSDVDDPFLPLPLEDLFFGCVEEIDKINTLIDTIKSMSTTMQSYGSCGNSALKVAMDMLKERNGLGSICMFYTTTPNCGLGSIKELKKDLQENFLEVKQKIFYDSLLLDLYAYNISVDIFIISSNNVRVCVPSLQYVAQNTGGKILFVENFIWQKDYKEIYMNIMDTLTSEDIAYCCELKLRYSQHMSVKKLFCCNNNFNSIISVDTIKIPKIRHDQTFAFLLNYSDISESKKQIYFQCACMYTNLYGDRFVRLHTTHMNLTSSLSTVFRYTDAEALMSILIKQFCTNILHNDNYSKIIIDNLAAILFSYRLNCASSAHSGQLILPDTLKLLPLFTSSLLKHNVTKKEILHDLKVYSLIKLLSMPIISSLLYVYPVTYVIHIKGKTNELDSMDVDDDLFIPKTIPSSAEKIYSNGIYLLDACTHFYLYFGFHSDANFAKEIVGDTPTEKNAHELNLTDTPNAQKVQRIIKNLTRIHHFNKYVPLVMVAPKSNEEEHLISLCVEDKADKEYSYVNFLCFIHKLVHKRIDES